MEANHVRIRRHPVHRIVRAACSFISIRRHGLIFAANATKYADYFQNSIIATDVHRRFCLDLAAQFPDYSDDLWGITASDSREGYVAWGGPPATGPIDGTRRAVRRRRLACRFFRKQRCVCLQNDQEPLSDSAPGAATDSWMHSTR